MHWGLGGGSVWFLWNEKYVDRYVLGIILIKILSKTYKIQLRN